MMEKATDTISLRVPVELKNELEILAQETHRKKSEILLEWITEKLSLEKWQIKKIEEAIEEADKGLFATEEEIAEIKTKWQVTV